MADTTGPAVVAGRTTTPLLDISDKRRGFALTAALLVGVMMGGTLPVPLYVLYEQQMGFGTLGVTVVFAVYVVGTLAALVTLGDLSDHFGRRRVMALAVACAAVSSGLFIAATGIGMLLAARIVSGFAAGFVTGTAAAALLELQPRGDQKQAAGGRPGGPTCSDSASARWSPDSSPSTSPCRRTACSGSTWASVRWRSPRSWPFPSRWQTPTMCSASVPA